MKIVQIGRAGHAFYAYECVKREGIDFAAIAPGTHGVAAEGMVLCRQDLTKRGFSPKLYDDYKAMIDAEKPDIAIVNPWFNDNGKVALFCCEHGIHTFCEKPLATDFETLDKLKKTASKSGIILAGMFDSRYMPHFKTVKNAIISGEIGEVRLMNSRKSYKLGTRPDFYKSRETYCGILPWVAIHAIDWMAWLSGEKYTNVTALHSSSSNGGNGDMDITSSALFSMTNGVIATVSADMYRPSTAKTHGDDRVRVVGTRGVIEAAGGKVRLINDKTDGEIELPLEPAGDIFDDFLAQIRGESNDLTLESCLESTYWSLKADESARKNCEF